MKLRDENQDYMDCRPLGRTDIGIPTPAWLQKLIDERKAKLAPPSEKPSTSDTAE